MVFMGFLDFNLVLGLVTAVTLKLSTWRVRQSTLSVYGINNLVKDLLPYWLILWSQFWAGFVFISIFYIKVY